ncbi:MAG: flippase-like domain-containing protein [Chloroflexi bacterium]|nr:flippase-like domain-containing protein [Chloroflexota bacterium]
MGLSFIYLGYHLMHGLRQIDLAEFRPRPIPLILAILLYTIGVLIGSLCWSFILTGLGQELSLRTNIKVHLSANIVKYLPGYGWQILGKAYLCNRQGIPSGLIGVSLALEFFSIVLTGLWVIVLTVPETLLHAWGLAKLSPWRLPGMAFLTALLIVAPRLLQRMLQYVGMRRKHAYQLRIVYKPLWFMLVLMILAWLLLGATLYTLTSALYPVALTDLPSLTFAWATSSLFSLAVIFVPTGLGVREGMLAFLLGFHLPMALAAIIAILARVISIVSEAFCFWVAQRL